MELPSMLQNLLDRIDCILFPISVDVMLVIKEIMNSITFPVWIIFVFFIPYVIPIPKESILLDIANINIFGNIITPRGIVCFYCDLC